MVLFLNWISNGREKTRVGNMLFTTVQTSPDCVLESAPPPLGVGEYVMGANVGFNVGTLVGIRVGTEVGVEVGRTVGAIVGWLVGDKVGAAVGASVATHVWSLHAVHPLYR